MKILLIDHDLNDFTSFKKLLRKHELVCSSSLEEIPHHSTYDLVILNIESVDAKTLLRSFDLPLIIVGNKPSDHPAVVTAIASGAQDYLIKKELSEALLQRSISFSCQRHQIQKQLRDLSLTDELTGLYNRRGFDQLLEQQISYAQRHNQPFLLITLDVNFFKAINDKFGHPIGDQALLDIAKALLESFRKHDMVARIGGDEFAVIAPNTTASEPLISHLLDTLDSLKERPYTLAVSVGESLFDPQNPISTAELIAQADHKLYCSKKQAHQARSN